MEIIQWLTDTTLGKMVFTMLVSMVPIIELRGGLPFGVPPGSPAMISILILSNPVFLASA